MKQERETNHKRLLISGNKLRVPGGDGVVGGCTLGRVGAVLSAVNWVRLMNHRSVPLKQILHYMSILKKAYLKHTHTHTLSLSLSLSLSFIALVVPYIT